MPRPINESQTIPIKLSRRLSYKHHYQFQSVRPKKVLDAAKYPVDTSALFKSKGIEVQNTRLDDLALQSSTHEEWSEFVQNTATLGDHFQTHENLSSNETLEACQDNISTTAVDNPSNAKVNFDVSDGLCEVDERPAGVTDTLLQEPGVAENVHKI